MSEWCLIESDPGVFTELVEKVGVKGLQFDEVFDMDGQLTSSDSVIGLIFLFKYEKQEPREVVQFPPQGLFFAKQVIQNACATQAILSVLLNSEQVTDLGTQLNDFKGFTKEFDAEMKGLAISNQDAIKAVHNSFARQSSFDFVQDKDDDKEDSFHFIGYVPYKGKVYELDGLQQGPIEIKEQSGAPAGTTSSGMLDWLKIAKPEIKNRIEKYQKDGKGEIRFNLLAITKDDAYSTEVEILKLRHLKQRANIKLVSLGEDLELDDEVEDDDAPEGVTAFEDLPEDVPALQKLVKDSNDKITSLKAGISGHLEKKDKWKKENERRRHDYVPFLLCALKHLAKKGTLVDPMFKTGKEKATVEYEKKKAEAAAKKTGA